MKLNKKIVLVFLVVCGCSVSKKQDTAFIEESVKTEKSGFFVVVPITKFSSIQSPCIDVDIGEKRFSMELDLGYRGDLSVSKQFVNLISPKDFLREKLMYGVRGKEYLTNLYRIPKASIGRMKFSLPIVQEEREEFVQDSTFLQDGKEPSLREPGRVGWELFYNVNLLVDIKKSQVAFCDSLDTLEKQGYRIESFTKTPLLLERGLVELEIKTSSKRVLRCALDTGATWNILNSEIREGQSMDQAMWDPSNILEEASCKINQDDFGPIVFHLVPIKIPIRVDAILGMEFFQENLVFLDFSGKFAYISKAM